MVCAALAGYTGQGSSARLKDCRTMLTATYRQARKIPKDVYVHLAQRMYLHETVSPRLFFSLAQFQRWFIDYVWKD